MKYEAWIKTVDGRALLGLPPTDFEVDHEMFPPTKIGYWLDNYQLHDRMRRLYKQKGGRLSEGPVILGLDDLDLLPLEASEIARASISAGLVVYYAVWVQ